MEGNVSLNINAGILDSALEYAHKSNTDLSTIVERLLHEFLSEKQKVRDDGPSYEDLMRLAGSIPQTDEEPEDRASYLAAKYK